MANIEKYLPGRFSQIEEFMSMCLSQNPEFENMEEIREKWLKNKFPTEADLDGIKIFEKILDIQPGANDSLEDRRFNVLTRLNQKLPYTWIQLHRMMAALCGWEGYELKLEDFILTVYLAMDSQPKLHAVIDLLADVLPMHILINIIQAINWVTEVKARAYTIEDMNVDIVPYQKTHENLSVIPPPFCKALLNLNIQIKPDTI